MAERTHRLLTNRLMRRRRALIALALSGVALAACGAPGSGSDTSAGTAPSAVSTDITIDGALIAAFTAKYPKIKITGRYDPDNVQAVNAPRVLASATPPDIARIIALVAIDDP